jgi:hypothetical protein
MKNKYHKQLRQYANYAYGTKEDRSSLAKKRSQQLIYNKGEMSAYRDVDSKKIYVAHRGTSQKRDFTADIAIGLGLEKFHPRFRRAKRESTRIQRENPDYRLVHTGHSLGGSIAGYVGNTTNDIVTFNKGAGIADLTRKRKKHQIDYVHGFDPVSLLSQFQMGGKQITSNRFTINPHSSQNL